MDVSAGTNFGSVSGLPPGKLTILNGSAIQYSVTFASNGGSAVSTRKVAAGGTVVRPANPTIIFCNYFS